MNLFAEPAEHLTPANAPNKRRELKPLPLRVAQSQYQRLVNTRNRTGISVQEHIRRAIDLYLAVTEKEAIELGLMEAPKPTSDNPNPTQPLERAVSLRRPRTLKR